MLGSLLMSGRNLGTCELLELALDRHDRRARVEPGELREADLRQRAPDGGVESLPGTADAAVVFQAAVSAARGTIRQRDRSLQRIEDGGGADGVRCSGQLVSTPRAAHRVDQARAVQLLEQL